MRRISIFGILCLVVLLFASPAAAQSVQQAGGKAVIAAGSGSLAGIGGGVWAWGSNEYGQLGVPQKNGIHLTPGQAVQLNDIKAVSGGWQHSLALKKDGTVWAWGNNSNGDLGYGYDSAQARTVPVQIPSLDSVTGIAAGLYQSLAVKSDGTVWAWGGNDFGELGDGTHTSRSVPVQVKNLDSAAAVTTGGTVSLALKKDGTVWAWGESLSRDWNYGPNAKQVAVLDSVTAVAGGMSHAIALKRDGTVWAFGDNGYGQLGSGTVTAVELNPVQAAHLDSVVSVAAGDDHSLALRSDGTVWAWGRNNFGQLGDGSTQDSNTPKKVAGLDSVVAIAGGADFSLAVKSDGTVWAWGDNGSGQLGSGDTAAHSTPVQVTRLGGAVSVSGGTDFSLAADKDGRVWAWGNNGNGQLGDGSPINHSIPVLSKLMQPVALASARQGDFTLAVDPDGSVWAWGNNGKGQLGD
ncbi:RCC1-like domain-containing protein [Paenibacillus humicola]|uniref:RCC1-like domain-containing protein n=1 Tax=Paenibacillus humicola TaxID=3110540 RepID=UPI00237A9C3E|nr:RCC1 domain-containing protein [Paenibacillus humicola]